MNYGCLGRGMLQSTIVQWSTAGGISLSRIWIFIHLICCWRAEGVFLVHHQHNNQQKASLFFFHCWTHHQHTLSSPPPPPPPPVVITTNNNRKPCLSQPRHQLPPMVNSMPIYSANIMEYMVILLLLTTEQQPNHNSFSSVWWDTIFIWSSS